MGQGQTEQISKRSGPLKTATCAAQVNTTLPWGCTVLLMFLHIAETQKMGHDVQEKPGQISRPSDWNYNDLSPFKEPDLLHTASIGFCLPCSFQQVSKALKFTCCFMTARGDWPAMSRQGLYRGLDLPHSPALDIPTSAQTDTHGEQYSVPPTNQCVMLNLHPLLSSKPQQHWEFRRLLHNCGVSATQHRHQFLRVGTSVIQKGN